MYGMKYKNYGEFFFEYANIKINLMEYKCLCFNQIYWKAFDENLKKRFANTYKFAKHVIDKFILLLRKFYLY